jgi:hypothetical protein
VSPFRFVARADVAKLPEGAVAHDVSSRAKPPLVKLSPFYPHGAIPVPGLPGTTSDSVEGVWQGLKIIDGRTDATFFTGKGKKRRGRPTGHSLAGEVLGYVDARRRIYIPVYEHMWRECIGRDVRRILFDRARAGVVQYFYDFDRNADVDDPSSPLSHASILVRLLDEEYRAAGREQHER